MQVVDQAGALIPGFGAAPGAEGLHADGTFLVVRQTPDGRAAGVYRGPGPPPVTFASLLAAAPRAVKYAAAAFAALVVLLGFAYLGSTVLSSRYAFQEVTTAPGRSIFFKIDRWTGEMTRCVNDTGAVGVVC